MLDSILILLILKNMSYFTISIPIQSQNWVTLQFFNKLLIEASYLALNIFLHYKDQ